VIISYTTEMEKTRPLYTTLCHAIDTGELTHVEQIFSHQSFKKEDIGEAFVYSCKSGCLAISQWLFRQHDLYMYAFEALRKCVIHGQFATLKWLIETEQVDYQPNSTELLRKALSHSQEDMFKYLVQDAKVTTEGIENYLYNASHDIKKWLKHYQLHEHFQHTLAFREYGQKAQFKI